MVKADGKLEPKQVRWGTRSQSSLALFRMHVVYHLPLSSVVPAKVADRSYRRMSVIPGGLTGLERLSLHDRSGSLKSDKDLKLSSTFHNPNQHRTDKQEEKDGEVLKRKE